MNCGAPHRQHRSSPNWNVGPSELINKQLTESIEMGPS
jgi:hypothetical protein